MFLVQLNSAKLVSPIHCGVMILLTAVVRGWESSGPGELIWDHEYDNVTLPPAWYIYCELWKIPLNDSHWSPAIPKAWP